MNILTLFWNTAQNQYFHWEIRQQNTPSDAEPSADAYQIESHELLKADLSCLSAMAANASVRLVVASCDAFSAQIEVPKKAQRLLRKAVPYMLEEEIATSVDAMFFALGERNKQQKLGVRAIEKYYLETILQQFKQAEIDLQAVYLDGDFLAAPEQGIRVIVDQQHCWFINEGNERWNCHIDDFNWLVQKTIASTEDEELPVAIPLELYAGQECDAFIHNLPTGRFAVEEYRFESRYPFLLDNQVVAINLLQAEYEVKKESNKNQQFFMQIAKVASIVLAVFLLHYGTSIYTLSAKKQQLEVQKMMLYKQAFPKVKKIRDPVKSMRQYLAKIGASSGDGSFLTLLLSASEQISDLSKIYPTNLSYDNQRKELKLDLIASDLMTLDYFADALKKNGHQVERSSETQRGSGYASRLTLRKK